MNTLTGIGVAGRDKRLSSAFGVDVLTMPESQALWRSNDLAARVVETWPGEMLRQGYELQLPGEDEDAADGDDDLAEQVEQRWEELGLTEALHKALCYERAYGGAAVFMATSDSADLALPMNLDRVVRLESLTVFEPDELQPSRYYSDPRQPKYGQVEVWTLNPHPFGNGGTFVGQVEIHESRMIIFGGIRVTNRLVAQVNPGWGDSVLTRVNRVLRGYDSSWDATSILMQDFAQAVFKMQGLYELIGSDDGGRIRERMMGVDISRSVARAVFVDAEREDFERKATPVTGLPELLDRYASRLAAAADMPLTLLMGQSPGGLNATGESDITFFYDRVASKQVLVLRPAIKRVTRVLFHELGGEPDKWSIKFRPLRQSSDKEGAEARNLQSQVDERYVNLGVATPEEIAKSRFGGQEYSFQTTINFDERDFAEEMESAEAADNMLAEAKLEAVKQKVPPSGPPGAPSKGPPGAE